jgi:hypothetical protein
MSRDWVEDYRRSPVLKPETADRVLEPKVCVSVLNWNNYLQTIQCIQALRQSAYTNYEILIVDNASMDRSVERLQEQFPDAHIICASENLGYAGGNQLALEVALENGSFELFWILNNDALVRPDTLGELIEAYRKYGGNALYGGILVHEVNGEHYLHMRVWKNRRLRVLHNIPVKAYFKTMAPRPVEALSGSHLLMPLMVVRQYGFMDTSFFLYSEDTDYCFQLRKQGVFCIEVPSSMVNHYDGASHKLVDANRLTPIIRYYRARNRIVLFHRYFGFTGFVKEISLQVLYSFAWMFMTVKRGPVALRTAYYSLLGVRDGLFNRMGKTYAPEEALKVNGQTN